tara:strand:+ start:61 stop:294 length:234 start_codon:yes stop_codon:yes gene_type:complete
MKVTIPVILFISSAQSYKIGNGDVKWTDMPYGPYFKEFDPLSERAAGRPNDSNFRKPDYKDMAGANTGTLNKRQSLL